MIGLSLTGTACDSSHLAPVLPRTGARTDPISRLVLQPVLMVLTSIVAVVRYGPGQRSAVEIKDSTQTLGKMRLSNVK